MKEEQQTISTLLVWDLRSSNFIVTSENPHSAILYDEVMKISSNIQLS